MLVSNNFDRSRIICAGLTKANSRHYFTYSDADTCDIGESLLNGNLPAAPNADRAFCRDSPLPLIRRRPSSDSSPIRSQGPDNPLEEFGFKLSREEEEEKRNWKRSNSPNTLSLSRIHTLLYSVNIFSFSEQKSPRSFLLFFFSRQSLTAADKSIEKRGKSILRPKKDDDGQRENHHHHPRISSFAMAVS